ncbi:hypothetical protein HanPSC8_Chr06g0244471 [Helianthus annuus]|nr:hypothetical protein HanPSC8_Chr06g0244471 [Helianthus annuus]
MNNYTETNSSTEPPPIHGDILDAILSHIPLIHLIPLSHVSKAWTASVSSAFRTSTNPKPWLVLHTQSSRHSYQYQCPYPSTHAYDPDSNKWIRIHTRSPTTNHITTLRSSHSNLLYTLSNKLFILIRSTPSDVAPRVSTESLASRSNRSSRRPARGGRRRRVRFRK